MSSVRSARVAPVDRSLVLDANILVRAVLGRRVLELLESYSDRIHFAAPETAYSDVRVYLP